MPFKIGSTMRKKEYRLVCYEKPQHETAVSKSATKDKQTQRREQSDIAMSNHVWKTLFLQFSYKIKKKKIQFDE